MNYGSVCSGIEAATVAWHPLGWRAAFFAEIDRFPSRVLAHHYPDVPNAGDFTTIQQGDYEPIDVLVGGTPCQDFSVAGLRAGMDGARGQLTVEFAHLAGRLRPKWVVWENVPGVLSIDGGQAFGTFIGLLGQLGYGIAYRVLDAQYSGVPQRRRRVFVVGHSGGEWQRAAAVLFESHSLSGDTAPRRKKGKVAPRSFTSGSHSGYVERVGTLRSEGGDLGGGSENLVLGGFFDDSTVCMSIGQSSAEIGIGIGTTLNCNHESPIVTHALRGEGFDAGEDGTGRGTPLTVCAIQAGSLRENPESGPDGVGVRTDGVAYTLEARAEVQAVSYAVRTAQTSANGHGIAINQAHTLDGANGQAIAFSCKDHGAAAGDVSLTLRSMGHDGSHANAGGQVAVAIDLRNGTIAGQTQTLQAGGGTPSALPATFLGMAVRRLTPMECERLQGFPEGYTKIDAKTADGPRYKALGNSMAVPVMRWIGERIQMVEAIK